MEQSGLALEIQRSLDYVESFYGLSPISGIAVIPLKQNTEILLNSLTNNHGITARIMDLSTIINSDILLDDNTQSLCAPVIGATLRNSIES
jgi:MSHA biogenesis protein MshI